MELSLNVETKKMPKSVNIMYFSGHKKVQRHRWRWNYKEEHPKRSQNAQDTPTLKYR